MYRFPLTGPTDWEEDFDNIGGGPAQCSSPIFVLNAVSLMSCILTPAAKLNNHWQQLSACFKLRHKCIDQSQCLRWYFASGKQDDNQLRSYESDFGSNFVSAHRRHLVVEEHCIALAHCHKSECLSRRCCRENCVSRPLEQRLFVAQDRVIGINAENDLFRGWISRGYCGLLPTSGPT